MKLKSNLFAIIGFCGACISFYIGAGFATMQEVVQYEASYGSLFPAVILVAAVIYVYPESVKLITEIRYKGL